MRADQAGVLWGAADAETERRPVGPGSAGARTAWGPLLDEASPEFLSSVNTGRQLDLWDAVAIALGEDGPPQTVP
jgi:hypothetical protein